MPTKKSSEVATRGDTTRGSIELIPVPMAGRGAAKYNTAELAKLGDEFGLGFDTDMEEFTSEFLPTPKWTKPGEMVYGFFVGIESGVGPNQSEMYTLRAPSGDLFSVWGSTTLDRLFVQAKPNVGDKLIIIFCGEVPTDRGLNDLKLFDLKMKRVERQG